MKAGKKRYGTADNVPRLRSGRLLGDLNKDGKLSGYEKARQRAIQEYGEEKEKGTCRVEADIRKWSAVSGDSDEKMVCPCPYAKQAWLDDKVTFSVNTGISGLIDAVREFKTHNYDIVVWADEDVLDMEYLDGFCDGMNELMSVSGIDLHLMVFHPDFDAEDAGLDFLIEQGVTDADLEYCMVFVQRLSLWMMRR